jgi:hypothetical protein
MSLKSLDLVTFKSQKWLAAETGVNRGERPYTNYWPGSGKASCEADCPRLSEKNQNEILGGLETAT